MGKVTGPYDHAHSEFLSYAIPQLPTRPTYFIDGQFKDEDYEYGSFTQSRMYMKDVRCGDCHNPHSLKRKFDGNALCTQCHRADEYDTFNHHMHKSKGEKGTSFVNKLKMRLGPGRGMVTYAVIAICQAGFTWELTGDTTIACGFRDRIYPYNSAHRMPASIAMMTRPISGHCRM